MDDMYTYQIKVRGPVDAHDLNATSPLQMTVEQVDPDVTLLSVRTDQSGMVGLMRHLHGRGLVLLSANGDRLADSEATAPPKRTSRRQFLKLGGLTVATVGLTLCGVNAVAPDPPPIRLPSFTYGGKNMNERILVAYASATGSTIDVAAAIGETLGAGGLAVDVKPVQQALPVDGARYRAVVLGSAVQHGTWLPEAIDFARAQQPTLGRLPVALFCVHIRNLGGDDTSRQNRRAYLDTVRPLVQPVAEGYLGGRFNRRGAKLMLPGLLARFVPTLDFRNWEAIRAWAEDIHPLLSQAA